MGTCIYCKQPAGFLRRRHKECHQRYLQGKSEIISLISQVGTADANPEQLTDAIKDIASSSRITDKAKREILAAGWKKAVDTALADDVLSPEEEHALMVLQQNFSLTQQELNDNGAYTRVAQGAVIREVLEGKIPQAIQTDFHPFNLQKTEQLVWLLSGVDYYEERTRTHYRGGSQGASIRIAKGVYYRFGGFKAEPVHTSENMYLDTGAMGITNKHIYFAGESKRFRIKYEKIMAFEPFSDGIGIQRDAMTAKPQTFITEDSWFIYNLITNLARM